MRSRSGRVRSSLVTGAGSFPDGALCRQAEGRGQKQAGDDANTNRRGHVRSKIMMLALLACANSAPGSFGPGRAVVLPGIDVLLRDSLQVLGSGPIGLVTNQGGIDAAGKSDVERLREAGARLVALFSPEHGFRGTAEPGETVASTRDSATGLPIYSLYGTQRAPTDSMLAGIRLLLVDLPDVGTRTYTYLSTTIEVMRAAARQGVRVVILDRPNPIGGTVQGDVLDTVYRSFVGPLAMPMRHGMTIGELARLANRELAIHADLGVIPVAGWSRGMTLLDTKLPFVPPSPNLKDPESLFHYPGTVLFEGTALSVGRGTDAPFRQIGAPWLDAPRVRRELEAARLPGVRFQVVEFTPRVPSDDKYAAIRVQGIRVEMRDASTYDPLLTAVTMLARIHAIHPDSLGFRTAGFDRLAGGSKLREAILAGMAPRVIVASWQPGISRWEQDRRNLLLYR